MSPVLATLLWPLALLLVWAWRPRQPITPSALLLLIAFGLLGAWTLWFTVYARGTEPAAIQIWKPTVLYGTLAAILIAVPLLRGGYPAKIILGTYFTLSSREWRWVNRVLALLCLLLAVLSRWLADRVSPGNWEDFKYSAMMLLLVIVLFRLNFVWLPILADVCIQGYRRAQALLRTVSSWF